MQDLSLKNRDIKKGVNIRKLLVYADFEWLKESPTHWELCYESLRGSDNYSFTFNSEWLKDYGNLCLSDDLNNYPGMQHTARKIFSDVF